MIDNYKIIKKLGTGGQGTVYLIQIKNKKYALKIEKIIEENIKKSLSSSFWREIEFANNMNKKCPNHFIKLYNYDIIDNCKFNLDNPNNIDTITELNKSNYCSRKIYEYVDTTLNKIINKLKLNELYSILIQLVYAIYIMHKNGYIHTDLHRSNIGIVKTSQKYINILNNRIPTFGYIVKIIDYGLVLHKKYKFKIDTITGIHESKIFKQGKYNEINRIKTILFEFPFYDKVPIDFWAKYDYDKDIKNFLLSDIILVDNLVNNDNDKFLLYQILYPRKYQKSLLGDKFKKPINNIIRVPIEDIIFCFNSLSEDNIDIVKIINYFIIKLS